MGYSVPEPIRDDDDFDAFALVDCFTCDGRKVVERERADGTVVQRACRECRGRDGRPTGTVLQGEPPGSRYGLVLDYSGRARA